MASLLKTSKSFKLERHSSYLLRWINSTKILVTTSHLLFRISILATVVLILHSAIGSVSSAHSYNHRSLLCSSRPCPQRQLQPSLRPERVSICSDVAEGMAYLHHHAPVQVIHCDLKPSNILLSDDMTAIVSDFGIARLVSAAAAEGESASAESISSSTAALLRGSIGYVAPEYGYGSRASAKGDVYSFGIVVLGMVTGKRPTDAMFAEGVSLIEWVKRQYGSQLESLGMDRVRCFRLLEQSLGRCLATGGRPPHTCDTSARAGHPSCLSCLTSTRVRQELVFRER